MKYVKYEIPDLRGEGKNPFGLRPLTEGHISWQELRKRMCFHNQRLSDGDIVSVVDQLQNTLLELMAEGYSVEVGQLGNFSATLGLKEGKKMDSLDGTDSKRNAQSIKVDGININVRNKFVDRLDKMTHLEYGGTVRLRRQEITKEQRLAKALEFIQANGYMTVGDYCELVNMTHTPAAKELRAFSDDPQSGIARKDRGVALKYVASN